MSAKDSMAAFVRWVMRDVTYHKHYRATVVSQLGDTLDIRPDDESIRANGLQRVPIDYGLPGVSAQVLAGTKVTLYFAGGDPKQPRIHSWEGGAISISFANGTQPLARVGDTVTVQGTGLTSPSGAVTGVAIGTITGGSPVVKA